MIWGYAGPWYGQFLGADEDKLMAQLRFLVEHDLQATHISLREVAAMHDARRGQVADFLAAHNLHLIPGVHFDFLSPDEDLLKRQIDEAISNIREYTSLLRAPIVTTLVGRYHRFQRQPSLAEQMERLPMALRPLAEACAQNGTPLGIENHGDYYCQDLVELCQRVPHLRIFLDTGNTYLIGEPSLPAIRVAAPLTIGTHFKDHLVRPMKDARPLHFEVAGSVLGEGDVGLAEAYHILLDHAPDPPNLVMMLEMISPQGMDPMECLDKSLAFVRSLPEAT